MCSCWSIRILLSADGKQYIDKKDVYPFAEGNIVGEVLLHHNLSEVQWDEKEYIAIPQIV